MNEKKYIYDANKILFKNICHPNKASLRLILFEKVFLPDFFPPPFLFCSSLSHSNSVSPLAVNFKEQSTDSSTKIQNLPTILRSKYTRNESKSTANECTKLVFGELNAQVYMILYLRPANHFKQLSLVDRYFSQQVSAQIAGNTPWLHNLLKTTTAYKAINNQHQKMNESWIPCFKRAFLTRSNKPAEIL